MHSYMKFETFWNVHEKCFLFLLVRNLDVRRQKDSQAETYCNQEGEERLIRLMIKLTVFVFL